MCSGADQLCSPGAGSRELHRRQALNGAAAAALAVVAAPASPVFAVDAAAAIAVERSGFAPTVKQTGRISRYECGRGVRRGTFMNRRVDDACW